MPTRPLIALTRSPEDNATLMERLENAGFRVVQAPTLSIRLCPPTPEELHVLSQADMEAPEAFLFASRHGVEGFFSWLNSGGVALVRPRLVSAVGPATARALAERDWPAQIVADPPTGRALAEAVHAQLGEGVAALCVRGVTSRDEANRRLAELGHRVLTLTVYRNEEPEIIRLDPVPDGVVAASPLSAKRFLRANPAARDALFFAIGPSTAEALRDKGLRVRLSASTDDDDLFSAVLEGFSQRNEKL